MYQLIRSASASDSLIRQVPSCALSIVIAEAGYKFHSFTLECLAFLATWYVLDAASHLMFPRSARHEE